MFPQTLAQELGFMVTAILHLLQKKCPKIDLKLSTYKSKMCRAEIPKEHGLVLVERPVTPLNINDKDIT